MIMKKLTIFLFFFFLTFLLKAQDWKGFVSDYRSAIESYESGDLATCIRSLKKMELFRDSYTQKGDKEIHFDYYYANSLIGDVYLHRGMDDKGLPLLMEAYQFFKSKKNNDSYERVSDICRMLADYYHEIDDKDKAYFYRKESVEYSQLIPTVDDDTKFTHCIKLLALAQECLTYGEWDESLDVIKQFNRVIDSIKRDKLDTDSKEFYDLLFERSILLLVKTYDNLSGFASFSGDYKNAIKYFDTGSSIAKNYPGLFCSMGKSMLYLAEYYVGINMNDEVEKLIEQFCKDHYVLYEEEESVETHCNICFILIGNALDFDLKNCAEYIVDHVIRLSEQYNLKDFTETAKEWKSAISGYGRDSEEVINGNRLNSVSDSPIYDGPNAVSNHERTLLEDYYNSYQRLVESDGAQSTPALEEFFNMYLVYKNTIKTGSSYAQEWLGDNTQPLFSYDSYLSLISDWREILVSISKQQGVEYLSLLKKDCTKRDNNQTARNLKDVDFYSQSLYDECRINIRFQKMLEFERAFKLMIESLKENDCLSPGNAFILCANLANELMNIGKGDVGYDVLFACDSIIEDLDDGSNSEEHRRYTEKLTTRMAEFQWALGNTLQVQRILIKTRFTIDDDFRHQIYESAKERSDNPDWPGEYDSYVKTVNDRFPFYDVCEELYQIALLARSTYDNDKRIQYLEYALQLMENTIIRDGERSIDNDTRALIYNDCGISYESPEKQIEYLLKALKFVPKEQLGTRINLAAAYASDGQYNKAEEQIRIIDEHSGRYYLPPTFRSLIYKIKAEIKIQNGEFEAARVILRENLDYMESDYVLKTQSLGTVSRESYWDTYYGQTIEDINSIECRLGNDAPISYDAALFQKGILISQKQSIRDNIRACNDSLLISAYEKYLQDIISDSENTDRDESEMMDYYAKHPEFVSSFAIKNWKDVQALLKNKEIAIEFSQAFKGDDLYLVALVLTKRLTAPEMLFLCKVDELTKALSNQDAHGFSRNYNAKDSSGDYLLYSLIWSPLEHVLKDVNTIYFSPYGPINSTNIEYLKENDKSKCMADKYAIYRVSSTLNICNLNSTRNAISATLIGNLDYDYPETASSQETFSTPSDFRGNIRGWKALFDTKKEIDDIKNALSKINTRVTVYEQDGCTESIFKSMPKNSCNILHIATHGYYFQDNSKTLINGRFFNPREMSSITVDVSDRSGLILSGANHAWRGEPILKSNDGILTAGEIEGLEFFDTDMLVLSACQTALGDVGSDGIYGLQRSFKISGVNTIVMSLWEVNSTATQEMMSAFYKYLSTGKSKHEAFYNAIDFLRKKSPEAPELWMPFIMLD